MGIFGLITFQMQILLLQLVRPSGSTGMNMHALQMLAFRVMRKAYPGIRLYLLILDLFARQHLPESQKAILRTVSTQNVIFTHNT